MKRTILTAALALLFFAAPALADCVVTPDGKGRVCDEDQAITTAASVRELAAPRVRTELTVKALAANAGIVRCGPMPVTTTTGVELAANQSFTWDQILPAGMAGPAPVFLADADIGCVAVSGTQNVNRSENYK